MKSNFGARFEKSLYDLIRGLRNHKGNEKEYIQNSLRECRTEIKGADMDLKATALLKLIYLEMFGHDMSWASFHVLEVMSSAKYGQKRVGYLGAVQSFRADTEVLMLATNLLKKDLASSSLMTMSLPIVTLPHVITSSLAMSTLSDLLPRLTHSSPAIRKKTIVTLYRLALVYPETLRPAWPKIKERLMDEGEDASVTAAIVNVVCELGWRRPQDFLPLAPRLFELLVDSGNNWMAIKLIKLFATLTPLEPRLVKKLLPPLTSIIRTTPAMSLLYECINGIIEGGILGESDGSDEIATLCVSKLRGMIMVEGDANLKYVALLAFNKIVLTHPYLVAEQEDVIMECIDSADMSIRLRALDLVVGMVSSDNLMSIVGRLMRQLRNSPIAVPEANSITEEHHGNIEPTADSDDEAPEVNIKAAQRGMRTEPPLPDHYKVDVITRILSMCASNNYSNLVDFDWYIDILTQLVRSSPLPSAGVMESQDISEKVGNELRNIAVKVAAVRTSTVRAGEGILLATHTGTLITGRGSLRPVAWLIGEFSSSLASPEDTVTAILQLIPSTTSAETLAMFLQTIIKILSRFAGDESMTWTIERKTMMSLLMARILHTLEPLSMHPDLEVQERAVEFVELLRLAAEATSAQETSYNASDSEAPLLLTQAIPSLFAGPEIKSVAPTAQKNVPLPEGLDLDAPINIRLNDLLYAADSSSLDTADEDGFEAYYHQPVISTVTTNEPAANRLGSSQDEDFVPSYQQSGEDSYLDPDIVARRKAERQERNKDDPFYIAGSSTSGVSTPIHNIIQDNNGTDLDVDAIPIMQLDLGKAANAALMKPKQTSPRKVRQRVQIAADETLASGASTPKNDEVDASGDGLKSRSAKVKQSLLFVDSSNIGSFSLEGNGDNNGSEFDYERQQREEAEMAKAMREVERLRLEMQRASERIQAAQGVENTVVKKKKKKAKPVAGAEVVLTNMKPKKKKKKPTIDDDNAVAADVEANSADVVVKKTKKKKKVAIIDEGTTVD